MKKNFGKIKLNQFSNAELERRKLNSLRGGCECSCRLCIDYCAGYDTFIVNAMDGTSSNSNNSCY